MYIWAIAAGLLLLLLILYVVIQTFFPKIHEVSLPSAKLASGRELRILQVTDLHNHRLPASFLQKLPATRPDLIAITGDLINGRERNFDNVFGLIERLAQVSPNLYYCTGNNDWEHKKRADFYRGLEERGVVVLHNKNAALTIRDLPLNIVGVDDPHTKRDRLQQAFAGLEAEELRDRFTLLLAHDPMILKKQEALAADLILSGHTHGGQVRFPIVGAVVAPGQKMFPHYDKGTFELDEDTVLYIDSGLGTSRLPVRFLNRSQVTLLQIQGN
jgi:uncharacterized protein